jgi:hypothetical protein
METTYRAPWSHNSLSLRLVLSGLSPSTARVSRRWIFQLREQRLIGDDVLSLDHSMKQERHLQVDGERMLDEKLTCAASW